jgi:hypothetical protein
MATLTVELPLNHTDRAVLEALLTGSKTFGGTEPVHPSLRRSETPPEAEEDVSGLMDKAVEAARALMEDKKHTVVKDALAKAGVERVSHLSTPEQFAAFMDALA